MRVYALAAPNPHSNIQQVQHDRIHLYRVLFIVELLVKSLTLLRGCNIATIPITIVNGRARPLLFRPTSTIDVATLLDIAWGPAAEQLWHWD